MSTKIHTPTGITYPRPIYLDCNATTPIEAEVLDTICLFLKDEFGNDGSRTHEYGGKARQAVQGAREQIARVVGCEREEVVFTSGATEANNLAILGLEKHGRSANQMHIVSTQIEHKAVLEPLEEMARRGFEITLVSVDKSGRVDPAAIERALKPNTVLVSVMHANNETGVIQPIEEIAAKLERHGAYFHVDAAQTFGKLIDPLRSRRIDLISISAHKTFGPKGIGALIARRREFDKVPLAALFFGGGQERGLRPGTLPVHLIAGFGKAAHLALLDHKKRKLACTQFRQKLLDGLSALKFECHGDQEHTLPHVLNLRIKGINSETAMVALREFIAISNGSACTSSSYRPSHVLEAMGLEPDAISGAIRLSWCHLTLNPDWGSVVSALSSLA